MYIYIYIYRCKGLFETMFVTAPAYMYIYRCKGLFETMFVTAPAFRAHISALLARYSQALTVLTGSSVPCTSGRAAVRAHRRTAAAHWGSSRQSHECSSRRRRQH